jgi:hypothetical protein
MNPDDIDHILNTSGILKNFGISKRITSSEISEIKRKIPKKTYSKEEYDELLRNEMLKYTNEYLRKNKIPGLILNKSIRRFKIKNKKYKKIYRDVIKLAESLKQIEQFTKKETIFYIVSLIGYLGLTESDFAEFNKNLTISNDDVEEYKNEGDLDEESDDYDDDDL